MSIAGEATIWCYNVCLKSYDEKREAVCVFVSLKLEYSRPVISGAGGPPMLVYRVLTGHMVAVCVGVVHSIASGALGAHIVARKENEPHILQQNHNCMAIVAARPEFNL